MAAQFPPGLFVAIIGAIVFIVVYFVGKERFGVPVKPSLYQDKRYVTPAGNTIVY